MFEAAVDRLRGSVAGAGAVEVGQDVGGALLERAGELADLDELDRNGGGDPCDRVGQEVLAQAAVVLAVGGDDVLVDALTCPTAWLPLWVWWSGGDGWQFGS